MNKRLIKLEDLKVIDSNVGFIAKSGAYISEENFFDFSEQSKEIKKQTKEEYKYSFITDLFSIYCAREEEQEYFLRTKCILFKTNKDINYSSIFFDKKLLELNIINEKNILHKEISNKIFKYCRNSSCKRT